MITDVDAPKFRGIPAWARESRARSTYATGPQPPKVAEYIRDVLKKRAEQAKAAEAANKPA